MHVDRSRMQIFACEVIKEVETKWNVADQVVCQGSIKRRNHRRIAFIDRGAAEPIQKAFWLTKGSQIVELALREHMAQPLDRFLQFRLAQIYIISPRKSLAVAQRDDRPLSVQRQHHAPKIEQSL